MSGRIVRVTGAVVLTGVAVCMSTTAAWAKTLSDSQWRKQANAACKQFQADRTAILPASGATIATTKNTAAARQYVDQAGPLYDELITSIDALAEPKAKAKSVAAFLAELKADVAKIRTDPMAAFSAFEDPFEDANVSAKKLKLASCAGLASQRI